ncbi:hypothetical protein OROGR_000453 [Orobanche gracilis]
MTIAPASELPGRYYLHQRFYNPRGRHSGYVITHDDIS